MKCSSTQVEVFIPPEALFHFSRGSFSFVPKSKTLEQGEQRVKCQDAVWQ